MSADREVTRIVRSWLQTDEHESAERVLDAVLGRLDTTPQRGRWWLAWRRNFVSKNLKAVLVGAAVLAFAAVGLGLYVNRPAGVGSDPSPSPTLATSPTLAPSPSPTAASSPLPLTSGQLDAGRYTFGVGPVEESGEFQCCGGRYFRTELTLPEGWSGGDISSAQVALGGPSDEYLEFFALQRVYKDPCHPESGYQGSYLSPSHAQDVVSEFGALIDFEASEITETTIAGLPTTHLVLSNDIDTEASDCTDGGLLPLFMTLEADKQNETNIRTHSPATNGGTTEQIWVVDRNPFPLVIVGGFGSDEQAGRDAIEEILASIDLS